MRRVAKVNNGQSYSVVHVGVLLRQSNKGGSIWLCNHLVTVMAGFDTIPSNIEKHPDRAKNRIFLHFIWLLAPKYHYLLINIIDVYVYTLHVVSTCSEISNFLTLVGDRYMNMHVATMQLLTD